MADILFTPAAVLDLLLQIDELKDIDFKMSETLDGNLELTFGNSIYVLHNDAAAEVEVSDGVIEEVEDINMSAYDELSDSGQVDLSDTIESGIIKEVAKTLLLGGLVRLTGKLLK